MKKHFLNTILPAMLLITAVFIIGSGCSFGDAEGFDFYYQDADGDGFGAGERIEVLDSDLPPAGYVGSNTDCDDTNADISPDSQEVPDNAIDEDCNGLYAITFYEDEDGDGFGDAAVSNVFEINLGDDAPNGTSYNSADCNDMDPTINPKANEIFGNDLDDNCNGEVDTDDVYIDEDGDGYGSVNISALDGVNNKLDCDDNNEAVYPYAQEEANGIDDDCDGVVDELF